MAGLLAVDYAWVHPDPGAIAADGYSAVIRYLSTDPTKDISTAEASALHAAGLGVGVIWESTGQRALGSTVAGQADGAETAARLRTLGAPAGMPVLVNVGDWAVEPAQLGAITAYYFAFREQLAEYQPGAGGYGTGYVIKALAANWPSDIWWQNAIDNQGVPGSVVVDEASIYQRTRPTKPLAGVAGSYDEDAYGFGRRASLSWWFTAPSAPPPPPPPSWSWSAMPEVKQGDTGPAVRTVQALLVARYYRLGTTGQSGDGIDGDFGPLTDAAVREAQGAAHITVDGIVGPQTWPVLAGA